MTHSLRNKIFKNKWLISVFILGTITTLFLAFKQRGAPASLAPGTGLVKITDLIQRVTIAGTIIPNKRTLITAPYNGYVRKLFVKVGDLVKSGDPVVSIAQSLQSSDPTFPLRSPLSGTVVQLAKAEGEYVREGDTKEFILRIDDLSKFFVISDVPEIDRVKIRSGQAAIIKTAAILTRTYQGVIKELALAAKQKEDWGRAQVEFQVKIEVLDPDLDLKPGMSAFIDIVVNKKDKVLTLRHEFIHKEADRYFVILKTGQRRDIKVGIQNEEAFEIIEGLKDGEQVRQVDFASQVENS